MLPSGATAGPSVNPPSILALRVKSSSSFEFDPTSSLPSGDGMSPAWASEAISNRVVSETVSLMVMSPRDVVLVE